MKSKIEDEAKACAQQQAGGTYHVSEWFTKGFLRGANFVMKEAERLATRPHPNSHTLFEPFVDLHRLKALFEKEEDVEVRFECYGKLNSPGCNWERIPQESDEKDPK